MKYYRAYSNPLIPITEDKIKAGDIVYDELGRCVRKVYVEDRVYFVEMLESVLVEGEVMSELTKLQLELFWNLSRTKLRKYEDQTQSYRRHLLY
jgi:hypothetical protein